jgi:hypothetical protein
MTNNYYETITNMFKTTDYTFDRVLIYNDEQSTGVLELEINKQSMTQSLTLPNNKMLVNNKNGVWSFNGFRDNAINRDLNGFINSEWNDIKTYYNGTQGYIDYIPKNIDYNKNVYERGRFNINYVRVRLYFKPNDNVLINTNVFTVVNTINR